MEHQKENKSLKGDDYLYIFGGIFILGFIGWYLKHDVIIHAAWLFMRVEAWILQFFASTFTDTTLIEYNKWVGVITKPPPDSIGAFQLLRILNYAGSWLRVPSVIGVLAIMLYAYKSSVTLRFTGQLNMEQLLAINRIVWPRTAPTENLTCDGEDKDRGGFTRSLNHYEFAHINKLIVHPKSENELPSLDEQKTQLAFSAMLGQQWQGSDHLDEWESILYAVFTSFLRNPFKDNPGNIILDDVSRGFTKDLKKQVNNPVTTISPSTSKLIKTLINEADSDKKIQSIISKHYYVTTVLSRLLANVHKYSGKLTTRDFIWLKPVNRNLFYALNNVDRPAPHIEASGVWYHYHEEIAHDAAIEIPQVKLAYKALNQHLESTQYAPPPLWDEQYNEELFNNRINPESISKMAQKIQITTENTIIDVILAQVANVAYEISWGVKEDNKAVFTSFIRSPGRLEDSKILIQKMNIRSTDNLSEGLSWDEIWPNFYALLNMGYQTIQFQSNEQLNLIYDLNKHNNIDTTILEEKKASGDLKIASEALNIKDGVRTDDFWR